MNEFLKKIKKIIVRIVRPNSKLDFVSKLSINSSLLDVGCGSHSSTKIKSINPTINYTGIDIQMYQMEDSDIKKADSFILTSPENFANEIGKFKNNFDSIICAHNLEHCNDYIAVTHSICNALKVDGVVYFSFPSQATQYLPKRKGTLNFYDDTTHINLIDYSYFINLLKDLNMKIIWTRKRYRPIFPFILGLLFEPFGRLFKINCPYLYATWALYGFETIIIAKRIK